MFSMETVFRNNNGHHIFDMSTHNRISKPKDIDIQNNVWIGMQALILGGAAIGEGSIIGARTVTSSIFGNHVIVVGNPGRVVKENICWNRDSEYFFSRDNLEQCISC